MIDGYEAVGRRAHVLLKTGQGHIYAAGHVIAFCPVPSFLVERSDGERISWRADMTEEVFKDDLVDSNHPDLHLATDGDYLKQMQATNDALSKRLADVQVMAEAWANHCDLECLIRTLGRQMLNLIEQGH